MNDIIKALNLTENELKVYTAIYHNPKKSAAEISRILKMDKSSAYKATDSLRSKGLVKFDGWKKGVTYSATNPESLMNIIKSKEIEIKHQKEFVKNFIEKLRKENTEERLTFISIDKGKEGLMFRMTESLNSKEKLIRESFHHHSISKDPEYIEFINIHAKERVKRKIHIRELQTENDRKGGIESFKEIMTNLKSYLKQQRTLPQDFNDNNSFRIWDDTVNFVSYDEKGDFIVVTIKDKYIVTLMKSIYDYLWRNGKEVTN